MQDWERFTTVANALVRLVLPWYIEGMTAVTVCLCLGSTMSGLHKGSTTYDMRRSCAGHESSKDHKSLVLDKSRVADAGKILFSCPGDDERQTTSRTTQIRVRTKKKFLGRDQNLHQELQAARIVHEGGGEVVSSRTMVGLFPTCFSQPRRGTRYDRKEGDMQE